MWFRSQHRAIWILPLDDLDNLMDSFAAAKSLVAVARGCPVFRCRFLLLATSKVDDAMETGDYRGWSR